MTTFSNSPSSSPKPSQDDSLGAVEELGPDARGASSPVSLAGQLGHRDQDPLLKDADSDFPEPDAVEEHTGESRA